MVRFRCIGGFHGQGSFIHHKELLNHASSYASLGHASLDHASLDHVLIDQDKGINVARNICIMWIEYASSSCLGFSRVCMSWLRLFMYHKIIFHLQQSHININDNFDQHSFMFLIL